MERIRLVEPSNTYAEDIWAFRQEISDCDADSEDKFAGCMSLDTCSSAEEWIEICKLRKSEETCVDTGVEVSSTMYLAVRKNDNRIVGIIDLRHHINHPILGTWGGHCGYSVRPSERGKGYAKEMVYFFTLPMRGCIGASSEGSSLWSKVVFVVICTGGKGLSDFCKSSSTTVEGSDFYVKESMVYIGVV